MEVAVKVVADFEKELLTLPAKHKKKLETAVKYLQEVVDEIDSQIID